MSDLEGRELERRAAIHFRDPQERTNHQRWRCRRGAHDWDPWNQLTDGKLDFWEESYCLATECSAIRRRPLPKIPVIYHSTPRVMPNLLHNLWQALNPDPQPDRDGP
jgi:hypothetical protein